MLTTKEVQAIETGGVWDLKGTHILVGQTLLDTGQINII